jgi:hypothetical protein
MMMSSSQTSTDVSGSIQPPQVSVVIHANRVLAVAQPTEGRAAKLRWDETLRGNTPNPGWTTRLSDKGRELGITAVAPWHNLELVVVGAAVTFLIDGVSVGTGTGIGASNYAPGFFAWNNAGPATNIFFDWFAAQLNFPR